MSKKSGRAIDQRLVKAVSHPLRVEVLEAIVCEGEISPTLVATKLGQDLSKVSYHVNVLKNCEVIELAKTRPRRQARSSTSFAPPSTRGNSSNLPNRPSAEVAGKTGGRWGQGGEGVNGQAPLIRAAYLSSLLVTASTSVTIGISATAGLTR